MLQWGYKAVIWKTVFLDLRMEHPVPLGTLVNEYYSQHNKRDVVSVISVATCFNSVKEPSWGLYTKYHTEEFKIPEIF
jgi:hypothetical protein